MSQLHMHVISDDMISDRLKNKKHWNSFTSDFFIPATVFLEMLQNGSVQFDKQKYEAMLNLPLACHKCKSPFPTIPKLKQHIQVCST